MGFGADDRFEMAIDKKVKNLFFSSLTWQLMKKAEVTKQLPGEDKGSYAGRCGYDTRYLKVGEKIGFYAGANMEKMIVAWSELTKEVGDAKKEVEEMYNQISVVSQQIKPKIKEQIQEIRSARMAAVSEIQATMAALKDIRKFFLESDYKEEIQRLREFTRLCEELKRLKEDGTLDALCDVTIKLGIGKL